MTSDKYPQARLRLEETFFPLLLSRMQDISSSYGVLLIGVLFATFFQGVLTVQAYQYYEDFPEDPRTTKIFVAVLWALDFIHLVLVSYTIYYYLVVNWGDEQDTWLLILPFRLHLFPIAFLSFFSQMFFLYRIWVLSERNVLLVGPVFICTLGSFGIVCAMATTFAINVNFPQGLILVISVGATTDVLIAALLCYYVRKRSEGTRGMRVTSTLVTLIIRYTIATSALTSLLNLACLFAYLIDPGAYIIMALNLSSGRTYANAVLTNLNARRKFRKMLESMEPSFAIPMESSGTLRAVQEVPSLNTSIHEQSCTRRTASQFPDRGTKLDSFVRVSLNINPPRSRHSLP
ncbi:hypothetical protein D9756_005052 [Leucocoprinus leucothites]|uniref:DUF6534 domain-containing protein n=1 Tax=Leucocoprinus leucothites TaxID=201217 RepID=A0A8H5G942_9AGAR|nr:hypothetical protein D9756_005052 [Leucoagaricus leucothites]